MKVVFIKNHLDNKKDDIKIVSDSMANYWIKTGVAKEFKKAKSVKKK